MDEVLGYLNLYKENAPQQAAAVAQVEAPVVDTGKIVEEALTLVADTLVFATLNAEGAELKGANHQINDAIAVLRKSWTGLTHGTGTWSAAKGNFVDTFARLVSKSATQVGHTGRTFADLNTFITAFAAGEGQSLLAGERVVQKVAEPVHVAAAVEHHHESREEEKTEGAATEEVAATQGDAPVIGEEKAERGAWRGRGGNRGRGNNRGGYYKRNHDEEGFEIVKNEDQTHPYRGRGGYRGNRGGEFRGGEAGEFRGNRGEFRGERREFRGERREWRGAEGGEFRGERREWRGGEGGEFRGHRGGDRGSGEFRGRGNRGTRGGDRPYTEHKPRGRGEQRNTEPQVAAGEAPIVQATQPVVEPTTTQ